MPADKDVLGKVDALLRRHSPGTATDPHGVPLLTELIDAPPPSAPVLPASQRPAQDDASALAQEVFERVLAEVEGRLAAELERRLAQHLTHQVHAAVSSALGDLRQELANVIGDAVAEAIAHRHVK